MSGARRAFFLLGRGVFGAYFLLSSIYCVLAYNPFTYQQIIRFELLPWLTRFAHLHPWLYWPAQAALLATLARDRARKVVLAYAGLALVAGVALAVHPLLASLANDRTSLALGFVFLAPLLAVAALDVVAMRGRVKLAAGDAAPTRRLFYAALGAGLYVFVVYTALFELRVGPRVASMDAGAHLVVSLSSLSLHLIGFMAVFLMLALVRGLAGLWRFAGAELVLGAALAWIGGALTLSGKILAAISMSGAAAVVISIALAGTSIAILAGLALRVAGPEPMGGIQLLAAPLAIAPNARSPLVPALGLAILAAFAGGMSIATTTLDWNGLIAQINALTVWLVAFATLLARRARPRPAEKVDERDDPTLRLVVAALLVLAGYRYLAGRIEAYSDPVAEPHIDVAGATQRYAGFEPSFRILHEAVQTRRGDGALFDFLQGVTNISEATPIAPTDVQLVPGLSRSAARRPNIFIITIDSLRRDYLSPYNPDVHFTPGVEAFAKESHVFERAFTHYGATGLSEPSIWVGGMMPHKQYVTPFRPMNTLEKLLEAEDYDRFVSVDTILSVILDGAPGIVGLDVGVSNKDYDLCRSLAELQGKLEARGASERPVFAYTQPQNIHVSRIEREGKTVPADFSAPGFYAPYASRLSHIDGCFGGFIEFLRARHMLEDSIVILTADHGDSLGEDGRWGHAYTIYPEIVRIPLIVHLPAGVELTATDHGRTVFSTDITPTLYAILGHAPTLDSEIFGRPLFWKPGEEPAKRRDWQLIVSSYGPVYGILEEGKRLFIADGVNYGEAYYDLSSGLLGTASDPSASTTVENEGRIRAGVAELHKFYSVPEIH